MAGANGTGDWNSVSGSTGQSDNIGQTDINAQNAESAANEAEPDKAVTTSADSPEAAEASAILFSIVNTATANNLDVIST